MTSITFSAMVGSANLVDSFPDKEIELAVRIRSETEGINAEVWNPQIFIYRE